MRRSDKPYRFRSYKGRAISVEFRFMPGKRISTGCYDMPSAVLWAEEYLRNMGFPGVSEAPTFREAAKDFFIKTGKGSYREREKALGRDYPEAYYIRQQARLKNHAVPFFGDIVVTAITRPMIESWAISMRGARGQEIASDTRDKSLTAFSIVMDDLVRKGILQSNPADAVCITVTHKEREALPPEALRILFPSDPAERIKVWESEMWAVYFSIFYDTGWRPGEIAALRVCDIWQTTKGLCVGTYREVSKDEGQIVERVKTSRKGYTKRPGLLYYDTAELLIGYIEKNGLHGDDLLFRAPRRKDGLLMPETSNKHFKMILKKYGFYHEGIVQYCTRHTYTTQRRGDMPDELLAVSMGHTKLRDDYDHQKMQDLIRRLDAARDSFFENRKRIREGEEDILPFEEARKKQKA